MRISEYICKTYLKELFILLNYGETFTSMSFNVLLIKCKIYLQSKNQKVPLNAYLPGSKTITT